MGWWCPIHLFYSAEKGWGVDRKGTSTENPCNETEVFQVLRIWIKKSKEGERGTYWGIQKSFYSRLSVETTTMPRQTVTQLKSG
jgi:hypothetical protein